jgi:hypothetical protein
VHLAIAATLACTLATAALPRAAHAQLDSAMMGGVTSASIPGPLPDAASRHTRVASGIIGGAVLGGIAGYMITKGACNSCDDAGPLWFGALLGGVGGAAAGVVVARSRSTAVVSEARYPRREPRRLYFAVRVRRGSW